MDSVFNNSLSRDFNACLTERTFNTGLFYEKIAVINIKTSKEKDILGKASARDSTSM
jgi:hypothetical protein